MCIRDSSRGDDNLHVVGNIALKCRSPSPANIKELLRHHLCRPSLEGWTVVSHVREIGVEPAVVHPMLCDFGFDLAEALVNLPDIVIPGAHHLGTTRSPLPVSYTHLTLPT